MRTKHLAVAVAVLRSTSTISAPAIFWVSGVVAAVHLLSCGASWQVAAFGFGLDGRAPARKSLSRAFTDRSFRPTIPRSRESKQRRRGGCCLRSRRQNDIHHGYHGYTLEADSDPKVNESCEFTEEQIHRLIAKRLECKRARNFGHADKILRALNQNGVFLQDRQKKYRVDEANHFGRRKNNRYVQRGGTHGLSAPDRARIEELLEERSRCKKQRNFDASDDIAAVLKEEHGVWVDDKRREWGILEQRKHRNEDQTLVTQREPTEWYVPTPLAPRDHPTHTMDEETKELIRDRLRERSAARNAKNYKVADAILGELMEEHSVLVDDRTKEWKVVGGASSGSFREEEDDDAFAREALLSQRSAFVQKQREGKPSNRADRDGNRMA